jgi:Uncharacterized protein conserved in bacteria
VPARFFGTYHQKVDGKGRVSIPLKMRRVIESGDPDWDSEKGGTLYLVFGAHLDGFVEGYTAEEFDRLTDEIINMEEDEEGTRDRYQRLILAKAMPLDVDKSGRAILSKEIREKLGIGEGGMDLLFTGLGDRMEIWPSSDYSQTVEEDDLEWLKSKGKSFRLRSKLGKR